jgi:hypothetical protein
MRKAGTSPREFYADDVAEIPLIFRGWLPAKTPMASNSDSNCLRGIDGVPAHGMTSFWIFRSRDRRQELCYDLLPESRSEHRSGRYFLCHEIEAPFHLR